MENLSRIKQQSGGIKASRRKWGTCFNCMTIIAAAAGSVMVLLCFVRILPSVTSLKLSGCKKGRKVRS